MSTEPSAPHGKTVLVCPDCGHESPMDGDWTVVRTADGHRQVYECPACPTTVLTQPLFAPVRCCP